jgi:hypothetical protein
MLNPPLVTAGAAAVAAGAAAGVGATMLNLRTPPTVGAATGAVWPLVWMFGAADAAVEAGVVPGRDQRLVTDAGGVGSGGGASAVAAGRLQRAVTGAGCSTGSARSGRLKRAELGTAAAAGTAGTSAWRPQRAVTGAGADSTAASAAGARDGAGSAGRPQRAVTGAGSGTTGWPAGSTGRPNRDAPTAGEGARTTWAGAAVGAAVAPWCPQRWSTLCGAGAEVDVVGIAGGSERRRPAEDVGAATGAVLAVASPRPQRFITSRTLPPACSESEGTWRAAGCSGTAATGAGVECGTPAGMIGAAAVTAGRDQRREGSAAGGVDTTAATPRRTPPPKMASREVTCR